MKTKKVEIDGKEVEVREFIVADIEGLFAGGKGGIEAIADAITGAVSGTKRLLALCCPLTEAEISKLGINAYSRLVEAMKELNSDFFAICRRDLAELGRLLASSQAGMTATSKGEEGAPGRSSTPGLSTGS